MSFSLTISFSLPASLFPSFPPSPLLSLVSASSPSFFSSPFLLLFPLPCFSFFSCSHPLTYYPIYFLHFPPSLTDCDRDSSVSFIIAVLIQHFLFSNKPRDLPTIYSLVLPLFYTRQTSARNNTFISFLVWFQRMHIHIFYLISSPLALLCVIRRTLRIVEISVERVPLVFSSALNFFY